jgi:hypothetical protein
MKNITKFHFEGYYQLLLILLFIKISHLKIRYLNKKKIETLEMFH